MINIVFNINMALVLLSLFFNHDNLILKLHQKKIATLMKLKFLQVRVVSVPGTINKKCWPNLYINLYNYLKRFYQEKFRNLLLYVH